MFFICSIVFSQKLYIRHGQTAARGPHAALQRFFAAPVTNCNDAYAYYGHHFVRKNTLKWPVLGVKRRNTSQKKILRPAILFILFIWLASKKVWPPLLYKAIVDRGHIFYIQNSHQKITCSKPLVKVQYFKSSQSKKSTKNVMLLFPVSQFWNLNWKRWK